MPAKRPRATRRRTPEQAFGQALRELRLDKELSQEQLSFVSGLHDRHVSRLERGLNGPSYRTLLALADALDVAPSTLLKRAEELMRKRR